MPRKIFRETKMQGGNIYRPAKGKENIFALLKAKQPQQKKCEMKYIGKGDYTNNLYECSACGAHVQGENQYNFCPWCGAKIRAWTVYSF